MKYLSGIMGFISFFVFFLLYLFSMTQFSLMILVGALFFSILIGALVYGLIELVQFIRHKNKKYY